MTGDFIVLLLTMAHTVHVKLMHLLVNRELAVILIIHATGVFIVKPMTLEMVHVNLMLAQDKWVPLVEEDSCVILDFIVLLPTVMMMAPRINVPHKTVVPKKGIHVVMESYVTGD